MPRLASARAFRSHAPHFRCQVTSLTSYIRRFIGVRDGQSSRMHHELKFDDLDLREEPARFESDVDVYSLTTAPKSDTCSASCMTCIGA